MGAKGVVMSDPVHGEKFTMSLVDEWLVRIDWQPGTELTVDDAREVGDALDVVTGGRALPVLSDGRPIRAVSRHARVVFREFQSSAVATLVDSPLSRTLANFFIALSRPEYPIKLFDDEAAALVWLRDVS
jgi:hypothetical protein